MNIKETVNTNVTVNSTQHYHNGITESNTSIWFI